MTDIVERLAAAGCTAGCNSSPVCLCALCQDAAVEFRALRARVAELEAALRDGNRPLPYDRDTLGRMVREAWVRWAQTQPSPKPSWLAPYHELSEADKEADRQIGEAVARWTLIGAAARRALGDDHGR